MNVGSSSSSLAVVGYEWVRNNVLKYKSCLTATASVAAFQRQVKLANPEDSCKLAIQACESDDFLVFKAAPSLPPFFFMYRCLFEVLVSFYH